MPQRGIDHRIRRVRAGLRAGRRAAFEERGPKRGAVILPLRDLPLGGFRVGEAAQPVAPADLACCFIASSDSVVRKMIGVPLWTGSWRISRIISSPFMFGMLRSVMIMSKRVELAFARPSCPSTASMT